MAQEERSVVYPPSIGKTPNDWAEEEARRQELREPLDDPYGTSLSRRTRRVMGWTIALALIAMMALTLLGLLGVIDIFEPPSGSPLPAAEPAEHRARNEKAAHGRPSARRLKSDRNPRDQRESGRLTSRASSSFTDAPSSIGPFGELADRPGIGESGEPAPLTP